MKQSDINGVKVSMEKDTQYLLSINGVESLYDYSVELLNALKNGAKYLGKFHNGTKYETFDVTDKETVNKIKEYMGIESEADSFFVFFQEFVDTDTYESYELLATVFIYPRVLGTHCYEVDSPASRDIYSIIQEYSPCNYSNDIIVKLEKDFAKEIKYA
jgi:hypothetical protein